MKIESHKVQHGSRLALSECSKESLTVVVGFGGGCTLKVDAPVAGIWVPVRGTIRVIGDDLDPVLHRRELRVTEFNTSTQVTGHGNAVWVALFGRKKTWCDAFGSAWDMPAREHLLLPACYRIGPELRRRAISLARTSFDGVSRAAEIPFVEAVLELQGKLSEVISRCPGRTYAQRRQVFLRLQRVRNYLGSNCHLELDNDALARMANYSPCYFLRTFRAAYQQTPHAYLMDQRLQRAQRLLRNSCLAITEVAHASGFGNRCSFSRLFRKHFGTTAGALRREGRAFV